MRQVLGSFSLFGSKCRKSQIFNPQSVNQWQSCNSPIGSRTYVDVAIFRRSDANRRFRFLSGIPDGNPTISTTEANTVDSDDSIEYRLIFRRGPSNCHPQSMFQSVAFASFGSPTRESSRYYLQMPIYQQSLSSNLTRTLPLYALSALSSSAIFNFFLVHHVLVFLVLHGVLQRAKRGGNVPSQHVPRIRPSGTNCCVLRH